MYRFIFCLVAILTFAGTAFAQLSIGAASFAWPPPRLWNYTFENDAPCGSPQGPGSRTKFPIERGYVAFFAQFQAWNVELGISFASALYKDPKAATDFQPLIENVTLRELDIGISCISVPDAPSFVEAGHKATLQLRYLSDFGSPSNNKSFFACADITYVAPSDVPYWVPCLNTTAPDSDPDKGPVPTSTQKPKGRPKPTEEPEPSGDGWSPGEKPVVVRWKPIVGSFGVCFVMVGLGVIYWVRVIRPKRQRLFDEQIEREPAQWVPERG